MDLVSLLKIEHAVFKVRTSLMYRLPDDAFWEEFARLHDFVINVHAKAEDLYIFSLFPEREIHPFAADHKLIESLGNYLLREKDRRRFERYVAVLTYHNDHEELEVFPKVKREVPVAMDVIESYGLDRYVKFVGLDPQRF
ncbi:MAG: hemerythrin [Thermoproteus sp.]